ncbi:MAG: hypothetical protein R2684_02525 [Pyrinomonadaceae bacterium]
MKVFAGICLFGLLLASTMFVSAQTKIPMSQEEYVRELYSVAGGTEKVENLIVLVRERGIEFKVTAGLRSLTKSKSKNNAELLRTLEEANRRREDPKGSALPPASEVKAILEKTRKNTLDSLEEMPDFVVKQRIRRGVSVAGTNNFSGYDRLVVAVSYRAEGEEEYRLISQNGIQKQESETKGNYGDVGGTSSTGEFVTVLATIFKPESETHFEVVDTDLLRGRKTIVFDFSITKQNAKQMITSHGYITDSTTSGMSGRLWIDRELGRVLRIDSKATEIPIDFPITAASREIDYGWVKIADKDYLLPSASEVRLTFRESARSYESKNSIEFRDYQKYGTEVVILDDDEEFVEDSGDQNTPQTPPPLKKPVDQK